jgi:hypothetical protein
LEAGSSEHHGAQLDLVIDIPDGVTLRHDLKSLRVLPKRNFLGVKLL